MKDINIINSQIAGWNHYTLLFLNYFENKKRNGSDEYNKIFNQFLKESNFLDIKKGSFPLMHSGTILMGLYGVFVFPKEFWKRYFSDDNDSYIIAEETDKLLLENSGFSFKTKVLFEDCNNKASLELPNNIFLNRFRNSIAHARVEIDNKTNIFKFQNKKTNSDIINFSVTISAFDLLKVLNEFSGFYITEYNRDFQ